MARLTIDRVSKLYGAFRALDDVSLDITTGVCRYPRAIGLRQDNSVASDPGFDSPMPSAF